ncbi:MAG: PqqD family protein [Clostridia bacterium]|nr:PqqD family protein [Clostridia bacterium]
MKIKEGYLLREVAGSNIVVPVGEGAMDFSGVITLNEVGAFIWKILETGAEKEEIVEKMLSEYDVDKTTAENDVEEYIRELRGADLIAD